MRVLLLLAVMGGLVQAQLSLGPNGISAPPINLVTVYKYIASFFTPSNIRTSRIEDQVELQTTTPENDDDVESLNRRIDEANLDATNISIIEKVDQDPLQQRALLIPKKKLGFGKWPFVYGALNSLLLVGVLVLAKPYFYEGETIITSYANADDYGGYYPGHGHHEYHEYGPGYRGKGKGKGNKWLKKPKGKGKYKGKPKGYHSHHEHYYPKGHKQSYEKDHHSGERYRHRPEPVGYKLVSAPSSYQSQYGKHSDDAAPLKTTYAVIEEGGHDEASRGKPQAYAVVPAGPPIPKNFHTPAPPSSYREHLLPEVDPQFGDYKQQSPDYSTRSREYRDRSGQIEESFDEQHYFNPTVFTASKDSSYACLERMLCLNPSRSARALAMSTMDGFQSRRNNEKWAQLMKRLGDAKARGKRNEDCEQYFCRPQMPEYFNQNPGQKYNPPPKISSTLSVDHDVNLLQPSKMVSDRPLTLHQLTDQNTGQSAGSSLLVKEAYMEPKRPAANPTSSFQLGIAEATKLLFGSPEIESGHEVVRPKKKAQKIRRIKAPRITQAKIIATIRDHGGQQGASRRSDTNSNVGYQIYRKLSDYLTKT